MQIKLIQLANSQLWAVLLSKDHQVACYFSYWSFECAEQVKNNLERDIQRSGHIAFDHAWHQCAPIWTTRAEDGTLLFNAY